ncbi:related to stress response protein rds1p [Phialocephala subalpina]|uniref:Related to stress response protein rds1p n=1 Tax=Phialocephala subalpina TaxID=576137 RepID=A0A1L7WVL1_9HELO|nr:related to stress response protein rds1p [Phialocephala subalpina]
MYTKLSLSAAAMPVFMPQVYSAPAAPPDSQILSNTSYGLIPGESSYYSNYPSKDPPFPANITAPVLNTTSGPAGPDDLMWQNLLSAEWVIYSFYQTAVEMFNTNSFTPLGLPNTTYQRIVSIRDNEAGHLRIFQDQISSNSVKPGACKYEFPFTKSEEFLAFQNLIEISSMAFLTGLVQQGQLNITKGALTAVAETETRHLVWGLIDVWNVDPFAGPSDTSFPYANQILDTTNRFIVPGSCPSANPSYPSPSQHLPPMAITNSTKSVTPGSKIQLQFEDPTNQPEFREEKEYYAVWFHGVENITVPFDTKTNKTIVPATFEEKGLIIGVLADEEGATTLESVVAGPIYLLQQPTALGTMLAV